MRVSSPPGDSKESFEWSYAIPFTLNIHVTPPPPVCDPFLPLCREWLEEFMEASESALKHIKRADTLARLARALNTAQVRFGLGFMVQSSHYVLKSSH